MAIRRKKPPERKSRSPEAIQRRAAKTRQRRRSPSPDAPWTKCRADGCPSPTQLASGTGFAVRYCPVHYRQWRRHGGVERKSFARAELAPFIKAAERWLRPRIEADGDQVRIPLARFGHDMAFAGRAKAAHGEITRAKTDLKVKNLLARLREAKVKPRRAAAITAAVYCLCRDRWDYGSNREFRTVQTAKAVMRLAKHVLPGFITDPSDGYKATAAVLALRYRKALDSDGPILREFGAAIEAELADLAKAALPDVLAMVKEREEAAASRSSRARKRAKASVAVATGDASRNTVSTQTETRGAAAESPADAPAQEPPVAATDQPSGRFTIRTSPSGLRMVTRRPNTR